MRVIQKRSFYLIWANVIGILSNFGSFYDAQSPNMVMSRDPRCKISTIFYLVLILHLILGKVTKFLVGKLSTLEVISQKPLRENTNPPTPVPLGLQQKMQSCFKNRSWFYEVI